MTRALHDYEVEVRWTGDLGTGTSGYRDYARDHLVRAAGKPDIPGSSDPHFRGDPGRWSPEELLLASISACHKLWYLHLCADAGVVVRGYVDRARAQMREEADGGGRFVSATLEPVVRVAEGADLALARALHQTAHEKCFIARSLNFPVAIEAEIRIA